MSIPYVEQTYDHFFSPWENKNQFTNAKIEMLKIQMFRRRPAKDERERLEAFHSFLRDELTKELRQAIKLVQTESASQQAVLGKFWKSFERNCLFTIPKMYKTVKSATKWSIRCWWYWCYPGVCVPYRGMLHSRNTETTYEEKERKVWNQLVGRLRKFHFKSRSAAAESW